MVPKSFLSPLAEIIKSDVRALRIFIDDWCQSLEHTERECYKMLQKRLSTILILAVFSLVSLILICGCTDSFNPRLFTSAYEYNLQIQSDTSLHNVTFIIPLPVRDGAPLVGNQTLTAEDFRQSGVSAVLTQ